MTRCHVTVAGNRIAGLKCLADKGNDPTILQLGHHKVRYPEISDIAPIRPEMPLMMS